MLRSSLLLAVFLGLTGMAPGAFAAHDSKKQLSAGYLAIFQIGVHYQSIHALALFGVALLVTHLDGRLMNAAGSLFTLSILLLSDSLYLLALSGIGKLGIVTPFDGVSFLAGWLCPGLTTWCPGNA